LEALRPGSRALGRGALSALLALGFCASAPAQGQGPSEYDVKAAFLYNFALYVEWPPAALAGREDFSVGVLGKDVFDGALERTMKDRTAQGKPVRVLRFDAAEGVKPCHILFVPGPEGDRVEKLAAALKGSGTMIVTESSGALRRGAIINFFLEDKRVRIEVNPDAAARENLRVGAKVLRLAKVVKDDGK
jgi:hypothetical protein